MTRVYQVWVNNVQGGIVFVKAENEQEARETFDLNKIDWHGEDELVVVRVEEADDEDCEDEEG